MSLSIGEKLKTMRLSENFTQKELAEKIKVSLSVVCDIENNRRTPSKKVCLKLARFFTTSVDYWFNIKSEIEPTKNKFFYLESSINKLLENKLYKDGVAEDEIWEEILMCLKIDVAVIIKKEEKEVI